MRSLLTLGFPLVAAFALVGCTDPGASIEVEDARSARGADRRVLVDIDVLAREGLGGNIGVYCTRVGFTRRTGAVERHESCASDLSDGDTRTIRVISDDADLAAGAPITVDVYLGAIAVRRSLVAPA